MLNFMITDKNFHQLKSKQKNTKVGIVTKLRKAKHAITIKTNTMAPFAIYKWKQAGGGGEHFAISNRLDQIAEYIATLGFELTYTLTESKYANSKSYVDQARNCSNTEKVTCWNTVVVDCKGNLQITQYPKQPFLIPLTSKRGVKFLLKWLKKYLLLVQREIKVNNFIPTLTAGMDTRALTWLWRDSYHGPDYYLKAVKPGGKNDVARGKAEVEIATQVINYLGIQLERIETHDRVFVSGIFTDNGCSKRYVNDPDFIYDYIAFHFAFGEKHYFKSNRVCPFVDNLFLQLRHPEIHYMRTLLALLLCPDLLNIPFYSFNHKPQYLFNEKFADLIHRVEEFIQKYHLRQRVAKLKAKILSSK